MSLVDMAFKAGNAVQAAVLRLRFCDRAAVGPSAELHRAARAPLRVPCTKRPGWLTTDMVADARDGRGRPVGSCGDGCWGAAARVMATYETSTYK